MKNILISRPRLRQLLRNKINENNVLFDTLQYQKTKSFLSDTLKERSVNKLTDFDNEAYRLLLSGSYSNEKEDGTDQKWNMTLLKNQLSILERENNLYKRKM